MEDGMVIFLTEVVLFHLQMGWIKAAAVWVVFADRTVWPEEAAQAAQTVP